MKKLKIIIAILSIAIFSLQQTNAQTDNKTEQKVYENLIKQYPTLQQQYRVKWCKKKSYLPFDFVLEDLNIIVEQDGPQHFKQISNWQMPELTKINDIYKIKCANENRFSIIRLLQKDIWHDRYDWLQELLCNIDKIVLENKIGELLNSENEEDIKIACDNFMQLVIKKDIAKHCRLVAEELFSLEVGVKNYRSIYNKII